MESVAKFENGCTKPGRCGESDKPVTSFPEPGQCETWQNTHAKSYVLLTFSGYVTMSALASFLASKTPPYQKIYMKENFTFT